MKLLSSRLAWIGLGRILLLLIAPAPTAAGQEFYLARLRAGEAAIDSGKASEASEELRIAAFGLLDRPALLCEALEHLALAENSAGRAANVDAALARLAEASNLLPACQEARIDPRRRAELETLVRRKLPESEANKILKPPVRPTAPAPPAAVPTPTAAALVPSPVPPSNASPVARPSATPSGVAAERPPSLATPTPTLRSVATPTSPASVPKPAEPSRAPETARPVEAPTAAPEDLDRQPQIRAVTRPVYPVSAQRAGVGGIVLLRVLVSARGEPQQVEVARGIQAELDQAAIAAVRQWRFEPGQKGGESVAAWMTVAVPFDAQRR